MTTAAVIVWAPTGRHLRNGTPEKTILSPDGHDPDKVSISEKPDDTILRYTFKEKTITVRHGEWPDSLVFISGMRGLEVIEIPPDMTNNEGLKKYRHKSIEGLEVHVTHLKKEVK